MEIDKKGMNGGIRKKVYEESVKDGTANPEEREEKSVKHMNEGKAWMMEKRERHMLGIWVT